MIPTAPLNSTHPWRVKHFHPVHRSASSNGSRCRHGPITRAFWGRSEGPWRPHTDTPAWQKIGAWLATAGFAAALSFTCVTQSVLAVTNEQLLFLEAWRAVDRAYYDKNFNGKPWFRIREQYVKDKPLSTRQETYAAIRSLLAELDDPFTRFLEPSRYAALKRGTAGSVTGVGLEVGFDQVAGSDSELMVITPSADGPADKAGIKPRDKVVAIDGKPTAGTSLYDAGDRLQGPEGSQVTLTIKPADGSESREVQLMRQRIINNPVSSQLCQKVPLSLTEEGDDPEKTGKVGYIRVATFSKQTTDNVKTALHKLQAKEADMIILDIRNNGGGLFPAGVEVARELMNDGDIVLIADSQGVRDSYPASNIAIEAKKPLSVLVNRGTASASEVLAGALQDNGRAKIVGETTFGKGLIQTIVELSDGSGVAVTVARYQTPLGTDINKKGIQPDIQINSEDMPPTNGPGFCKYIASRGAAVLFDANAAAKMPSGGLEKRAEGAGESLSIDVTQYENAFISGQPAEGPSAEKKETESPSTDSPGPSESSPTPSNAPTPPEAPSSETAAPADDQKDKSPIPTDSEKPDTSSSQQETKTSASAEGQGSQEDSSKQVKSAVKSEAEQIPQSGQASSAQEPPQANKADRDSQATTSEQPAGSSRTEAPTDAPKPSEGERKSSDDDKKAPSESDSRPKADQGKPEKNESDPPISDSPAPIQEVTRPQPNSIAPSPVVKESSSSRGSIEIEKANQEATNDSASRGEKTSSVYR